MKPPHFAAVDLAGPAGKRADGRIPVLYLAPWVDYGGSDKGTIDWFRWLDRDRFAPSLITTQPSSNRRLSEIHPYAEEVWALPDLMAGHQFPGFIFDFLQTRGVRVLHVMNSRLGFDLLPDLTALDKPPAVVVQLHVEEPDKSGYVRYVTSRYGNLVHGFSVSSHHLAAAVVGYDVSPARVHVIPTGVDADDEFNPDRVTPRAPKDPSTFRVLFAGRLAEQKDPMMMLEVARRLAARRPMVRVEVVGDGPLQPAVQARAHELGLEANVAFHPPTGGLAPWMAASDALLMTSTFEGVPYVIYEAMAMALPVVAPALPGNVELIDGAGGTLVENRAEADAYVDALEKLIDDPAGCLRTGRQGRQRALERFTLRQMAEAHERLYDAAMRPVGDAPPRVAPPPALRLSGRPSTGQPLVSVITPCFNHGRYLPAMLDGLAIQDYPLIESIIVDDGSSESDTRALLTELEESGRSAVIYQDGNRGPGAARNRGIDLARGRYLLFVDSDNVLLPGAVGKLVAQLQRAGERVGFVYPGIQHFGNRDDCFHPPAYNLHDLLHVNFADTCSLFDRDVFDAGLRFAEDIELGHEDWDLVLQLGARDVIGEPSEDIVVLYRDYGFSRNVLVNNMRDPFEREINTRHPDLYGEPGDIGRWGWHDGPALRIKNRWNPALSVIALTPIDFHTEHGVAVLAAMEAQGCRDFELVAEYPRSPATATVPIRRLPSGLAAGSTQRLQEAITHSRGRYLLATDAILPLLGDPTTVEKLLRSFSIDPALKAIALADGRQVGGTYQFAPLPRVPRPAAVHTLAWPGGLCATLVRPPQVRDGEELDAIARAVHDQFPEVQWRHFAAEAERSEIDPDGARHELELRSPVANTASRVAAEAERARRLGKAPAIPSIRAGQVRRWDALPAWIPAKTKLLVRHRARDGSGYLVSNDRRPPDGYELDFDLGAIQQFSPPGTVRLVRRGGTFLTVPRGSLREPEEVELGHLEQVSLPLFVGIGRAVLDDGDETLILASDRDHLGAAVRDVEHLGFVEAFPQEPRELPSPTPRPDDSALLQLIDRSRRRHVRMAVPARGGTPPSGGVVSELGCLHEHPEPGSIAVWVDDDGHLWTDDVEPDVSAPGPATIARWVGAPLAWRRFGGWQGRARAVARRGVDGVRILGRRRDRARVGARLLGYLWAEPRPGSRALFAATHPVLDDTILVHEPVQATDMGYHGVTRLGFIDGRAPVTGALGLQLTAVPWASRFGVVRRV